MEERCPSGEYDRLLAWLRSRYYSAWVLGPAGGLFLLSAWWMQGLNGLPAYGVTQASLLAHYGIGVVLYMAGVTLYARSKGLSWAWGLMGLGCLFGWAVLLAMPKRCRYCGRSPAGRSLDCRFCGGPI